MDAASYGLIELTLVFGVVLALAIAELLSVRRALRNRDTDNSSCPSDAENSKEKRN